MSDKKISGLSRVGTPATGDQFAGVQSGANYRWLLSDILRAPVDVHNVMHYGAAGDGAADDTQAFIDAVAAVGSGGGVVLVPKGTYLITSTIEISEDEVRVVGEGPGRSKITFNPSAQDILFDVQSDPSGSIVRRGYVGGMEIEDTGPSGCTVFSLEDISDWLFEDIYIRAGSGIGIHWKGRDTTNFRRCKIVTDNPIQISDNPNSSIDIDATRFTDINMHAASDQPCVTIDSGVNLTNVTFDGRQSWQTGKWGLYWNDSAASQASGYLRISNVKFEQPGSAGGYVVYISHNHTLNGLLLENIYSGSNSDVNGIYLRKVRTATLDNCHIPLTSTLIDADKSVRPLEIRNSLLGNAGTLTTNDLIERVFVKGYGDKVSYALYTHGDQAVADQEYRISGTSRYSTTVELADDGIQAIPDYYSDFTMVQVMSDEGTGSVEGGLWGISSDHGNYDGLLISGSANCAANGADGKLSVYRNTGNAQIRVQNRLGETRNFMINVWWR